MSSKVTGLTALHLRLISVGTSLKRGAGKGLIKYGLVVRRKSLRQVPKDTGKLQSSLKSKVHVSGDNKKIRLVFSYRAIDKRTGFDYAPWQHEISWYKHAPGRKYRFLIDPLRNNADTAKRLIYKEAIKGAKRAR